MCQECAAAIISSQPAPSQGPLAAPAPAARFSVTTVLVGLNVAVFLAMVFSGVSLMEPTSQQLLKWGANWGPLSLGAQPWRMLTSNYVHIGALHILLNMWCLWNLGKLAERIFPPSTYVALYTICGLGGSVASLWWHPMTVGAGASGAIFGLAGALISVFYLGKLPIPPAAVKSTLKSLVTFAAYNLFFGLTAGIDNFAHLGGLVTGLAFGAITARHIVAPPEERVRWQRYASVGLAVVLLLATVGLRRANSQARPALLVAENVSAMQNILIALQRHDYDKAIAQLQPYIQSNPDEPEAHYLLGLAYLGKHQPDDAIPEFQQAAKLDPNYAEAEVGLGEAYSAKGMLNEAQDAFHRAEAIERSQHR